VAFETPLINTTSMLLLTHPKSHSECDF